MQPPSWNTHLPDTALGRCIDCASDSSCILCSNALLPLQPLPLQPKPAPAPAAAAADDARLAVMLCWEPPHELHLLNPATVKPGPKEPKVLPIHSWAPAAAAAAADDSLLPPALLPL
jgi:hypothetical protein